MAATAVAADELQRKLISQVQPLINKQATPGVTGYSAPETIMPPPAPGAPAAPMPAQPKPPAGGTPETSAQAPAPVPGMGGSTPGATIYPIQQQAQAMLSQVRPTTRMDATTPAPAASAPAPAPAAPPAPNSPAPAAPVQADPSVQQREQQLLAAGYKKMPDGSFFLDMGNGEGRTEQASMPVGAITGQWAGGYLGSADAGGMSQFYGGKQTNEGELSAIGMTTPLSEQEMASQTYQSMPPDYWNMLRERGLLPVATTGGPRLPGGGDVLGRPIVGGDAVVDPGSGTGTNPRPTNPPADVGGTNQGSGSSSSRGIPPGAGPSAATHLGGSGSANEDRRTFSPGDDLRFSVIDPGTFSPSADSTRARGLTMSALENAMTGPDRGQIAQDRYGLLLEDLAREEARSTRDIGRKNAAWGTLGSGMVTTDLADMGTEFQRLRVRGAQELGLDTADREVADRIARANLGSNVGSMFGNEDLDQAGFLQSQRNELRGERGYQYGVGRDAVADKESEGRYNEYLQNSRFSRSMQILDMMERADASADPIAALQSYEASLRAQGDHSTADEIAEQIARRRQSQGR